MGQPDPNFQQPRNDGQWNHLRRAFKYDTPQSFQRTAWHLTNVRRLRTTFKWR